MTILAYTDGASRGNPGESGVGIVLKDEQGNVITSQYGYIGTATNNIAEYTALALCLKLVQTTKCSSLVVHSDSELMVRQLNGQYKVKDAGLKKHFQQIQNILGASPFQFNITHIPREKNREADELANRGIDTKKILAI
ncbi:MAG: ribonuclease HI family protein [Ignavibacteriae bacterium]|nr:MAG: ribonuclease HI family protein [Ignavibacteriota bacterium]